MRIYADRLHEHLERQWQQVYLIFGNEPLLLQESRQAIYSKANQLGFEEKHRFTADTSLNWNEVYDCFQSMSLFSDKKIIEFEVPEAGMGATITKELMQVVPLINPDIVVIIAGNKLTKAQENAKWFKTLNQQGYWISCLTPDLQRLPQFVLARCRKMNLSPDAEATQMLAQWHEGNLFALSQSLEKLALLYPDGQLTLVRLKESLSRHNHFTAFDWIDAILAGKANRSQRILRQLESESIEIIILARTIQKELTQLIKMKALLNQSSFADVFNQYKVWQSKRPLYSAALNRLSSDKMMHCMCLLAEIEILAKTQYERSPWPLLQQLTLDLCLPQANLAIAK